MQYTISTVSSQNDLSAFIKLPWSLYRNNQYWVPPLLAEERKLLNPSIHPFHQHAKTEYFLLKEMSGKPVGRIASIINHRHNEIHKEQAGFFGFFECIDDHDAATMLFEHAERWLTAQGAKCSRGPFNFSTNETCGLLVNSFDSPPSIMMTYNHSYYESLMTHCHYQKVMDLHAYYVLHSGSHQSRMSRVADRIRKRYNIAIRLINMTNLDHDLEIIRDIYNKGWSKNWGFVPLTKEEFDFNAKSMKALLIPGISFIAEIDGIPAGFTLGLPNINGILKQMNGRLFPLGWLKLLRGIKKTEDFRVVALGILPEFQHMGIGSLMYLKYMEDRDLYHYVGAEMSWMLETNNKIIQPITQLGGKHTKTYRLFEKKLRQ